MKSQKVTKSSKFTQASPNDNEYRDYQNIGLTVLPATTNDEGNQNVERIPYSEGHCHNVNNSSELLLKSSYQTQESIHEIQRYSPERNANRFQQQGQDIELCNCITPIYPYKTRYGGDQCKSEQPQQQQQTVVLNRSFASLPKLENTNLSQVSLDRKGGKYRPKHTYVCEQNQRILRELDKGVGMRRIQSPEIINIHRGPIYKGHGSENCAIKEFKCNEHELRRGQSVRTIGSRSNVSNPKRRAAGDGMDAEMDDPELVFEMSSGPHLGDCQCPCDHVVYSPTAYTTCLQIFRPAEVRIISINECSGFEDKGLLLHLNVDEVRHTINGNISLNFLFDDKVKLNIRENNSIANTSRTYISNKSLCKIIDNYYFKNTGSKEEIDSFCPIPMGIYAFTDATSKFTVLDLPVGMSGERFLQVELIRNGDLLICRKVDVKSNFKKIVVEI